MQYPALHTRLVHPNVFKRLWASQAPTAAPPEHVQALADWAATIRDRSIFKRKETELRGAFLHSIFCTVLGYTQFGQGQAATLLTEQRAGTGAADASLGRFGAQGNTVLCQMELKGPATDNLDTPQHGRSKSAVAQVWEYGVDTPTARYMVVSNMLEIRLYAMGRGRAAYERFDIVALADSAAGLMPTHSKTQAQAQTPNPAATEYQRFMQLLSAPQLLGEGTAQLLAATQREEQDITQQLYVEYKTLRVQLIIALLQANPIAPSAAIAHAQKILDRVLFIAFAEDRGLIEPNVLADVVKSRSRFAPSPLWLNFQGLFRFIDLGHAGDPLIPAYNGGLFAPDAALDALHLPDDACRALAALGKYDFASDVPVSVLGHIFEQSVDDLEKLQAAASVNDTGESAFSLSTLQAQIHAKPTSVTGTRKQHGIVYTPALVTDFMVKQTVGALLARRQAAVRARFEAAAEPNKPAAAEPSAPASDTHKPLRKPSKDELKAYKSQVADPARTVELIYWQAWLLDLQSIKICDPACGSGAFLVAAFDPLEAAYQEIHTAMQSITGALSLFDTDHDILTGNLYGVDLNAESIEITMLSLWLKTAKRGKKLENLGATLKVGNSLIAPDASQSQSYTDKPFDWYATFPEVFGDKNEGGFDIILGNPPYVRHESISASKPYLQAHYATYEGTADLYVYFFEQAVKLLKPQGTLGFIASGTFLKAGFGQNLRRYLAQHTHIHSLLDFGDVQVFEGVTTYPIIVIASKNVSQAELQSAVRLNTVRPEVSKGAAMTPMPFDTSGRTEDGAGQSKNESYLLTRVLTLTQTLPADLNAAFDADAQTMPQAQLGTGADSWRLESSTADALRHKLTAGRETLKTVYGSPYRGLLTGLNAAFVLARAQRDAIVAANPSAAALFKPFLEGKDLKPWRVEPQDLYLLLFKRGQTRALMGWAGDTAPSEAQAHAWLQSTYPAVAAWLAPFEAAAKKRLDKGEFWWELRACSYYEAFEGVKIVYPEISQGGKFSFDTSAHYLQNTAYALPVDSLATLSYLNSKVVWYYLKTICEALRGGVWRLRLLAANIERIPVPAIPAKTRKHLETLASAAQSAAETRRDIIQRFGYQVLRDLAPSGLSASTVPASLPSAWGDELPDFASFVATLKTRYKRELKLAEKNDWDAALSKAQLDAQAATLAITQAEQAINALVYALFELSPAEIALIEAN